MDILHFFHWRLIQRKLSPCAKCYFSHFKEVVVGTKAIEELKNVRPLLAISSPFVDSDAPIFDPAAHSNGGRVSAGYATKNNAPRSQTWGSP